MSKHLTHPEHGRPIDAADMPVTTDPVEGGVRIENLSLPADHDARVTYRELTDDEKRGKGGGSRRSTKEERLSVARAFLRIERDHLLEMSDYTQMPDAPVQDREGWSKFRQELRDLPNTLKMPKAPKKVDTVVEAQMQRLANVLEDLKTIE